ncbi:MAG: PDZ domain-containing protein [Betaproteobacteria bacterium]|nr:PDZ domain-containing protein [Betaproteobacteria bacterium]
MSLHKHFSASRVLTALACTVVLSAPAAADHWRGHPGMGNYGHCPQYHGMDNCPHKPAGPMMQRMSGKMLGVQISDLPNAMLDAGEVGYGVNVEKVKPDSAAASAGIQAGDQIVEFAGKPVLSAERLRWLVRKSEAGKALDVKLMREGKPVAVKVTLAEPVPKEKCEPKGAPRIGT